MKSFEAFSRKKKSAQEETAFFTFTAWSSFWHCKMNLHRWDFSRATAHKRCTLQNKHVSYVGTLLFLVFSGVALHVNDITLECQLTFSANLVDALGDFRAGCSIMYISLLSEVLCDNKCHATHEKNACVILSAQTLMVTFWSHRTQWGLQWICTWLTLPYNWPLCGQANMKCAMTIYNKTSL